MLLIFLSKEDTVQNEHFFMELGRKIGPTVKHGRESNAAVPPTLQLLLALRFYATRCFQRLDGAGWGICLACTTRSQILEFLCRVIMRRLTIFLVQKVCQLQCWYDPDDLNVRDKDWSTKVHKQNVVPLLFMEMSNLSSGVWTLTGVLRVFTYKTQMSQPLISWACYVRVPTRKWWIDGRMWEKMLWMPQCLGSRRTKQNAPRSCSSVLKQQWGAVMLN